MDILPDTQPESEVVTSGLSFSRLLNPIDEAHISQIEAYNDALDLALTKVVEAYGVEAFERIYIGSRDRGVLYNRDIEVDYRTTRPIVIFDDEEIPSLVTIREAIGDQGDIDGHEIQMASLDVEGNYSQFRSILITNQPDNNPRAARNAANKEIATHTEFDMWSIVIARVSASLLANVDSGLYETITLPNMKMPVVEEAPVEADYLTANKALNAQLKTIVSKYGMRQMILAKIGYGLKSKILRDSSQPTYVECGATPVVLIDNEGCPVRVRIIETTEGLTTYRKVSAGYAVQFLVDETNAGVIGSQQFGKFEDFFITFHNESVAATNADGSMISAESMQGHQLIIDQVVAALEAASVSL